MVVGFAFSLFSVNLLLRIPICFSGCFLNWQIKNLMQVFDLSDVKPHEFVRYGLGCLEILAGHGDSCAKECREKMRVMV